MLRFAIRRLLISIPTLLVISFIVFALLDLAPSDPTANLPLTISAGGQGENPPVPRAGGSLSHSLSEMAATVSDQ